MKAPDVDLKAFEKESHEYMAKILKYFEKNAYGDKIEKKKVMKESMVDLY
jgi:hypothetical protein